MNEIAIVDLRTGEKREVDSPTREMLDMVKSRIAGLTDKEASDVLWGFTGFPFKLDRLAEELDGHIRNDGVEEILDWARP